MRFIDIHKLILIAPQGHPSAEHHEHYDYSQCEHPDVPFLLQFCDTHIYAFTGVSVQRARQLRRTTTIQCVRSHPVSLHELDIDSFVKDTLHIAFALHYQPPES